MKGGEREETERMERERGWREGARMNRRWLWRKLWIRRRLWLRRPGGLKQIERMGCRKVMLRKLTRMRWLRVRRERLRFIRRRRELDLGFARFYVREFSYGIRAPDYNRFNTDVQLIDEEEITERVIRVTHWTDVARLAAIQCKPDVDYMIVDAAMSLPPTTLIQIFGACTCFGYRFQTSFDTNLTARRRYEAGIEEWEVRQNFAEIRQRRLQLVTTYRAQNIPRVPVWIGNIRPLSTPLSLPYSVGDCYLDAYDWRDMDTLPEIPGLVIRCRANFSEEAKFNFFLSALAHSFRFQCID